LRSGTRGTQKAANKGVIFSIYPYGFPMTRVEETNTEAKKVDSASYRVGVLRSAKDTMVLKLSGRWELGSDIPSPEKVEKHLGSAAAFRRIVFHTKEIAGWDSGLVIFLRKIISQCALNRVQVDGAGLPEGVRRLLQLASAIPEKKDARKDTQRQPFLAGVGESTISFLRSTREMIEFVGEVSVAFAKLFTGKARFCRSDLLLVIQQSGAQIYVASIVDLTMAYGDFVVPKDLDFTIRRGEIFIIMGGSGCGRPLQ